MKSIVIQWRTDWCGKLYDHEMVFAAHETELADRFHARIQESPHVRHIKTFWRNENGHPDQNSSGNTVSGGSGVR